VLGKRAHNLQVEQTVAELRHDVEARQGVDRRVLGERAACSNEDVA
jgi:hypothetical protein